MSEGIVIRTDGPRFGVTVDGQEIACGLRGRLRQETARVSSPVVIGDSVVVTVQTDGVGIIEAVLPRRSQLFRPGFAGVTQVLAANVDQLLVVQSAREPDFNRHLIERFLVAARRGGVAPVVVITKVDLATVAELREWTHPLAASAVPVIWTSVRNGRGLPDLRQLLAGGISVLAGKSGSGKTSLLNALFPGWDAATAAVSDWSGKGRHTTTSSRLYPLPDGGYLADTPGIRTLGLFGSDATATADAFPEIAAAAGNCRFRDCAHQSEPGCAVQAAVTTGTIHPDRYAHFLRLRREEGAAALPSLPGADGTASRVTDRQLLKLAKATEAMAKNRQQRNLRADGTGSAPQRRKAPRPPRPRDWRYEEDE